MLFSSIPFLYYFLPCVLFLYFLLPKKAGNIILLIFSLIFYGWGEPRYLILMIISVSLGYVFGLLIEKHRGQKSAKTYMIISVGISLSFLLYFKYADFFITNFNNITGLSLKLLRVSLPIGISFYTFQIISYTIDVYRGDVAARKNPLTLALYVAMFPQLIAGPIVRYADVEKQLDNRIISFEKMSLGIRRFVIGLSKKVLIANVLGELCDTFTSSSDLSILYFWFYALCASLQIYFDFSGYSDMAIGLGKIFGFDFLENFDYPFISKSITEFWRRWHMSLGSWFRDYVYIPLGGNRVSPTRHIFNIFAVWFLTGFWHGADWNFIVWGVYFAVLLLIEKNFFKEKLENSTVTGRLYVIIFVLISFVIFNAASLSQASEYIRYMFGLGGIPLISKEFVYYFKSYFIIFITALIGSTPVVKNLIGKLRNNNAMDKVLNALEPVILITLFILSTAYIVDGSFNPFLYFRF
ncbi:MAG: MBOAT family protein [Anaerofustis stercorihominis]|nr:MBOAT family protein [Anaerofustis stercorihominis]